MNKEENDNYNLIEKSIGYYFSNLNKQPSLDEIAEKVHVSPSQFHDVFIQWVGVSPKKFLRYVSVGHAKRMLMGNQATLFETAEPIGFEEINKRHDLFIKIEAMTPVENKDGAQSLDINYSFSITPFGQLIIASTNKGICHVSFHDHEQNLLDTLIKKFPNASFNHRLDAFQENALLIYQNDWSNIQEIKLHIRGTDFQLKVWEALLKIPMGKLSTYGKIAENIGNPKASRAVGTAIGSNPIAFLIPCHRVIQSTGVFGGYMWGGSRKTTIIGWEAAKTDICFGK